MLLCFNGNFPAGETRWNWVGLQDVYVTICELTGAEIPDRSALDAPFLLA